MKWIALTAVLLLLFIFSVEKEREIGIGRFQPIPNRSYLLDTVTGHVCVSPNLPPDTLEDAQKVGMLPCAPSRRLFR